MLVLSKDLSLKLREGETAQEHEHRYFSPFGHCTACLDVDTSVRRKQTMMLNAATSIGLPRRFARDLYIDCQTIELANPSSFGLVLRENGSQLCYGPEPESYTAALYFVDVDDMQAFYTYEHRGSGYYEYYETAELVRVSKSCFIEWCKERGGVLDERRRR